ncbi:MAG: sulfurtransferase [Acidobacteria bacterium]|nr:sulfurtransferase [Acidobacteriota bacterium]MCW5967248.1 sulfurtransferase [Blastocatellales bacterium]
MLVSTAWLNTHIRDRDLVILHIGRELSQFEAGHIPGARFLPWSELVTTRDGILNELPPVEKLQALFTSLGVGNRGRIILYGDNSGLAAARAYFTLDYLGHGARCALLDGGLERWKADAREVSTKPVQTAAAEFTPRLAPSAVTDFPVMRDYSWIVSQQSTGGITILDSRPENQYRGEGASGAGRSGHIPGATNLYWMKHLESAENPVMRPVAELRRMLSEAGLQPGDKVITYCNTGVQASHSYFTAKYLGYDVSLYDGSFSEWSRIEGTRIIMGTNPK